MADDAFERALRGGLPRDQPAPDTPIPGTTVEQPQQQPQAQPQQGADPAFVQALTGQNPATREHRQGWGEWLMDAARGIGHRIANADTHRAKTPEETHGYDLQGMPMTEQGVAEAKKIGHRVFEQPPTLAERFQDAPALASPGAVREFATGATFGFAPRIEAGVRGMAEGSEGYAAELEKVRGEKEAWAKAHPELAGALEFGGGSATPMGIAKPLMGPAPGVVRQFGVSTGVGGAAAGLNAAGHTYGNPGDTPLDVLGQQVGNAMMAAPVGMVAAGVSVPILNQIFRGAGMAGRFVSSGGQSKNADRLIAESANKDRINLTDLEQNLPDTVSARARKLTDPNDIADARRLIEGGAKPQAVAKQYGVSARLLQQRLASEDPVPMNIVDLAKMERPGAGANLEGVVRAGARIPGENKAVAVEKLTQRQLEQQQRAGQLVRSHWGAEDYDTAATNLTNKIKTTNDTLYDAARVYDKNMQAQGTPLNIDSVLTQFDSKSQHSKGLVGRALQDAVEAFQPKNGPIRSINDFMQAKGDFDALIASHRENKPILRELMGMKKAIYDEVKTQNPEWWKANVQAADGFAAERAMQLGQEIALGTNRNTRDILKRVNAMSPDEKELARLSAGDTWQRHLTNQGEFNDITRRMRINAMRPVYETFLGKGGADKFWLGLKREGTTTQGFNTLRGSPTTPDAENIKELTATGDLMSDILSANPMGIVGRALARVRHGVNERNATDVLDKLLETDPELVRRTLRSSGAIQQQLGNEAQNRAARSLGAVSGLTDFTTGHMIEEMQRRRNEARASAEALKRNQTPGLGSLPKVFGSGG